MPSVTLWTVRATRAPRPERQQSTGSVGLAASFPVAEACKALNSPGGVHAASLIFLLLTPQHSEEEPCWGILRVARGQARVGIRAGCCGELLSTRSPWQRPHSSGRSHIPCPVNGTRQAQLGAEAGRAFTGLDSAQLGRPCKEGLFGAQPPRRHTRSVQPAGRRGAIVPATRNTRNARSFKAASGWSQLPRKNRNASWRDPLAEPNQNQQVLPTDLLEAQSFGISKMTAIRKT